MMYIVDGASLFRLALSRCNEMPITVSIGFWCLYVYFHILGVSKVVG